jgi:invasion protein IalB
MIGSFSIEPKPDKKIGIGAFVPLGFVIPAGVTLAVDGEKKAVSSEEMPSLKLRRDR